jgi:hypothetical protein
MPKSKSKSKRDGLPRIVARLASPVPPPQPCDSCGYSKVKDSERLHITDAMFEVLTERGPLYFCGHHFRKNEFQFVSRGFVISEYTGHADRS